MQVTRVIDRDVVVDDEVVSTDKLIWFYAHMHFSVT